MPFWTTEQHEMIRASVRRFAENEIAPVAEALWEGQTFPYAFWKKAAELGLTGLPYAEACGGGGGDWVSFAEDHVEHQRQAPPETICH